MANELTSSVSLTYSKGGAVAAVTASKQTDITTGRTLDVTQVIGTSEESVSLVDISSVEEVVIQNLDATNFVEVGAVTTQYSIKVKPGRLALFQPSANALFLKANTAACLVRIVAVNS
jgi:hypothetical protein